MEPYCTWITIGGNRIFYPDDVGTNTASLKLVKIVLNSVLSCPGARFACFDIEKNHPGTPMESPEYIHIKIDDILQEYVDEYNLNDFAKDGWTYFKITKGVYGLP